MWILLFDILLLIGFVIITVNMRKDGTLTAFRFALMAACFWSFVDLTAMLTLKSIQWQHIAFAGGLAIFQFAITFPLGYWFYRKFFESKR